MNLKNKSVLLISANLYPVNAGDNLFSFGMLRELCKNNQVNVITLSKLDKNIVSTYLLSSTSIYTAQEKWGYLKHIQRYLSHFTVSIIGKIDCPEFVVNYHWDVVIIDHLRSYGMFLSIEKKLKYSRLIYVAHNIEAFNRKQRINYPLNWKDRIIQRLNFGIDRTEKRIIKRVDTVFALTKYDSYVIRNLFFPKEVNVLTPIHPFPNNNTPVLRDPKILLVGSLNWYPNRIGVQAFLEYAVHNILRNEILIIGSVPNTFKEKWSRKNIQFLGYVKNIDEYMLQNKYLVVPNTIGTGIKMKILDGLNYGLKVIALEESLVGYESLNDPNLIKIKTFDEINEYIT